MTTLKQREGTAPGFSGPHLSAAQLAERWGVHVGTLANWRIAGRGCAYLKAGSRVLYRLEDVIEYEESNAYNRLAHRAPNFAACDGASRGRS